MQLWQDSSSPFSSSSMLSLSETQCMNIDCCHFKSCVKKTWILSLHRWFWICLQSNCWFLLLDSVSYPDFKEGAPTSVQTLEQRWVVLIGTILWTSLDIFGKILGMIWDGMVRLEVELNVVSSTFEPLHMTLGDARQVPNMNKTWSWSTNDSQKPSRLCHICKTFRSHTTLWCRTIPDSLFFFVLTGLSRRRNFVILIVRLFKIQDCKLKAFKMI